MLKIQIACEVPPGVKDAVQFESSVMNHITELLVRHGLTHEHEAPDKLEVVAEVEPVLRHLDTGPDDNRQTHEIRVSRHNLFSYSVTHAEIAKLAGLKESDRIPYRIEHGNMVSDVFFLNPREVLYLSPNDTILLWRARTVLAIHLE